MPSITGKETGATGLGLMSSFSLSSTSARPAKYVTDDSTTGMTWNPVPPPKEQCFETMNTALELGSNFWNGGELYGTPEYNSLHLLNQYFTKYPENADKVVLSIKGGLKPGQLMPDGSEANIRRSVDECVKVLDGKKKIDIFECARQDPKTSVEQTVAILAELVKEGKIGGIGLSEVDAETIRRAHKIHPIAAVEVELSLFAIDILQNDVAKVCAELGIPVIAYSPLCRGLLAGAFTDVSNLPDGDFRKILPKFQDAAMEENGKLLKEILKFAERKGVTPAQLALGWVLSLNGRPGMPTIIPIPGATTSARVIENLKGVPLLSEEEMANIDLILEQNKVVGDRYPQH